MTSYTKLPVHVAKRAMLAKLADICSLGLENEEEEGASLPACEKLRHATAGTKRKRCGGASYSFKGRFLVSYQGGTDHQGTLSRN